ncbi:site-specific integrase [Ralstonia solanacearum]|nr:site-specific integrase [Ralstonia solanacearum]
MMLALLEDFAPACRLPVAERDALIITYVRGPDGVVHPVSRYGEMVWDYTPVFPHAARGDTDKKIKWEKAPPEWVDSLKDTVATFTSVRRPGGTVLDPASMPKRFITLNAFAKWCSKNGIAKFSQVTPFHLAMYVQKLRNDGSVDRTVSAHVNLLRRVYQMRAHLADSFTPEAARELSFNKLGPLWEPGADELRRTELIPMKEAAALFSAALVVLENADQVITLREELHASWEACRNKVKRKHWVDKIQRKQLFEAGFPDWYAFASRLMDIRTAAYIVLATTTGCRVHELGDIHVGCVYKEIIDGTPYWWLKSSTRKIGDGPKRWLAPQIAYKAASILERYSEPMRNQLRQQLEELQRRYAVEPSASAEKGRLANEIVEIRRNVDRLFLSENADGVITSTDTQAHNKQLVAFAKRAGVTMSSKLTTHRFRRTYAVVIVRLNKGVRIDLATLRQHFQHGSMLMTEWYLELSDTDRELLELVEEEGDIFDMALVSHWLEPATPLAGGLGARIKAYPGRHHQPMFFRSRKEFIESIRDGLNIRSTGHSWCLAEGADCGGRGLFESVPCTDCGHGVIDESHIPVWAALREQQQELTTCEDIGIGGRAKAEKALHVANQVLETLLKSSPTERVHEPG